MKRNESNLKRNRSYLKTPININIKEEDLKALQNMKNMDKNLKQIVSQLSTYVSADYYIK